MDFLSGKSDDYNMEAWLQSKITSAEDKLNSVANYVTNNPEVTECKSKKKNLDKTVRLVLQVRSLSQKKKITDALEAQIVDSKR